MVNNNPIGVFDSGVGGLTVLRALREQLPCENFVYLGDTARLPYGTKSAETVTQYALQAARLLLDHDIKALVIACNTASALALSSLRCLLPDLPIVGVIEPGAAAAVQATRHGHITVMATEGTIRSQAYANAIHALNPAAHVRNIACTLLVALAEEGWHHGAIAEAAVRRYLNEGAHDHSDTIVLGCTHFPLLTNAIRAVVGNDTIIVDSAATTADAVAALIQSRKLATDRHHTGSLSLLATDLPERFARVAGSFLGTPITPDQVTLAAWQGTALPLKVISSG